MTEEEARNYRINPFDLTKVWPHGDFPLQDVGILELNRNPENYFADVEQAAFNPANVVPGISFSPDRMLQGTSVLLRRYTALPTGSEPSPDSGQPQPLSFPETCIIGMDRCAWTGTNESTLGYEPNSYGEWQHRTEYKEPPLELDGAAYQWDYREDDSDYYSQPGDLFRLMTPAQQQVLFENTARAMGDIPEEIKLRHIRNCMKADENYGKGVAKALNIPLEKI